MIYNRGKLGKIVEKFEKSNVPSIAQERREQVLRDHQNGFATAEEISSLSWEERGVRHYKEDKSLFRGLEGVAKPVIAIGAIALVALVAGNKIGEKILPQVDPRRVAVENCVGELVGRQVTIPRDALGELQHPQSVFDEQRACEQNENDPVLARPNLKHIPLGQ